MIESSTGNVDDVDAVDEVERLTESFLARLRANERPDIDEFLRQHPDAADELEAVLPAIVLLERHAALVHSKTLDGPAHASLPALQTLGDYTIIREIGRGGMGIVYEAVQQSLGRHVALKVLSTHSMMNRKHLERFRFEARAAAQLQHSHIVPVFGVGEFDGVHYYAMQYIHGKSLLEVLVALRQLKGRDAAENHFVGGELTGRVAGELWTGDPAREKNQQPHERDPTAGLAHSAVRKTSSREFYRGVARIGLQASEALAYAHSEGVLHRDIKPSNLLLDIRGNVWVADFGLAKSDGTEGVTETGDFVGTLRYMAPERLEGVLDRRSDVYGLGATLYELLPLQTFFETGSQPQLVDQILHHSPPPPSRFEKAIPRDLETIVLKAIAKEPAARYRTAEEMAEDLRRFLADRPILSRRPAAGEQLVRWCRRNPLVASLAATTSVLLMTAVIVLAWSNVRIRSEVAAKDKAMASARNAVHQLLTRIGSEKLNNVPMSHPLRVELLEDAFKAYQGLVAMGESDFAVRSQMAEVLHSIAGLQRELGRLTEAADALQRSANEYTALIPLDPDPPTIRETLGMVQSDLAYTWQSDTQSPNFKTFPIEAQYRKALDTFEAIEREFPQRRQPVTLCMRYLAEISFRRGDRAQAEQLWRESISRGEAFLEKQPTRDPVRSDLCWACAEYYEAILAQSPDREKQADAMLALGVKHAEILLQQFPESLQAADVLAQLHFRQALVYSRTNRLDKAIPIFHKAIREIERLCEAVPWHIDYWNTSQWFHEQSVQVLHREKHGDEVDAIVQHIIKWFETLRQRMAKDELPQNELHKARTEFVQVLRSVGRDRDADELARAATSNPTAPSR